MTTEEIMQTLKELYRKEVYLENALRKTQDEINQFKEILKTLYK